MVQEKRKDRAYVLKMVEEGHMPEVALSYSARVLGLLDRVY